MNFNKVSQLLSAYMDGELMGYEHRHIHQHLHRCRECRTEYEDLLQMKRMLSAMRMREPAHEMTVSILHRLTAEESAADFRWRTVFRFGGRLGPAYSPMVGLGLGLTVLGIGVFSRPATQRRADLADANIRWELADPAKDQLPPSPRVNLVQGLTPEPQSRQVSFRPIYDGDFRRFPTRPSTRNVSIQFEQPVPALR